MLIPKKQLYLNVKTGNELDFTIQIGKDVISQVKSAKLSGMTFEISLKWSEHIYGTGGLLASLNQRLFYIRRPKSYIGQKALLKISNGLFVSKIRYGLQLFGKVRWSIADPSNQDMEAIQKCLNKLLRLLNNSRISDKISTKSLLSKFNLLSVNQMNAQIKLTEIWKSVYVNNYSIKTSMLQRGSDAVNTRAMSHGVLKEAKVSF